MKLDFTQYFSTVVKLPLVTVYGCILSPALSLNNFQWESFTVDTSELLALVLLSLIFYSRSYGKTPCPQKMFVLI